MATKFRNSLFGFNKDDVMSYVLKTKDTLAKNEQTINDLKSSVESLNTTVKTKEDELSSAEATIAELSTQLDEYKSKEAVLTRLSESIGKLYLVAQANAKTIINSAKENAKLSEDLVVHNIETAENAENDLSHIEAQIIEKTSRFTKELDELKAKLEDTKNKVKQNRTTITQSEQILDDLVESVDAGLKV